jgi:hypothetical protein
VAVIAFAVAASIVGIPHANASSWTVRTATNSAALARSLTPNPPSTVTASCADALATRVIAVSWSSVEHATSYVVYQSTTSATSGYSVVATDVTTTAWLTATLKKGTYWYAVASVVGSPGWTSSMSAPTQARAIDANPRCS